MCSPGTLAHAALPVEAQHLAPVVLEEVDRLVGVAVRLAARLARLERHEGGELEDLPSHQLGGAEEHGGALARRRVAPRRQRRLGRGDRGLGLGTAAVGDRADDLGRPRRVHRREPLGRVGLAPADDERMVRAEPGAHRDERGVVGVAVLAPREVGVRLVDEARRRLRVGRRDRRAPRRLAAEVGRHRRRLDELLDGGALDERLAQERVVGGVLEQPPNEVGHARYQLADRRVLAQAQAQRADGVLDRLAHPVQGLDLERVVGEPQLARRHDRRRQRAHVVARERRAHVLGVAQHRLGELLVHRVRVGLVREDRHRPALLGGDDGLVVPVRALDETQVEAPVAVLRPGEEPGDVLLGVAQVGLDDGAGVVVGAELLLVEQRGEHLEGEVTVAELLEVERERRAVRHRAAHDRPQALLDGGDAAVEVDGVDLRVQRGDLEGEVDARERPPGAVVDDGDGRPRARLLGEAVDEAEVGLLIGLGLGLADARLAEHVEREAHAVAAQAAQRSGGVGRVAADDEALREALHLLADDGVGERRDGRARGGQVDAPAQRLGRRDALAGEVLAQMAGDLTAAAQGGEDVDEAQHLDLETLVAHRPVHHLALPALGREDGGL